MALSFYNDIGLHVIIACPLNTIGLCQFARALIPTTTFQIADIYDNQLQRFLLLARIGSGFY